MIGDTIGGMGKKFEALKAIGFEPAHHRVVNCEGLTADEVIAEVVKFFDETYAGRDDLPFGIDGVVPPSGVFNAHRPSPNLNPWLKNK